MPDLNTRSRSSTQLPAEPVQSTEEKAKQEEIAKTLQAEQEAYNANAGERRDRLVEDLASNFERYDTDKDGTLSFPEITPAIRQVENPKLQSMFAEGDHYLAIEPLVQEASSGLAKPSLSGITAGDLKEYLDQRQLSAEYFGAEQTTQIEHQKWLANKLHTYLANHPEVSSLSVASVVKTLSTENGIGSIPEELVRHMCAEINGDDVTRSVSITRANVEKFLEQVKDFNIQPSGSKLVAQAQSILSERGERAEVARQQVLEELKELRFPKVSRDELERLRPSNVP